ncbi:MAG: hypothetical protein U5R06_08770 [candidate division KSB1 bacterium]|nr:hypothetical protein [candidate division KSB1 bacterium]
MKYTIFIFLIGLIGSVSANSGIQFRVSAGLDVFEARTRKKNTMIMKTGYPVLKGQPLHAGMRVSIPGENSEHHFLFSLSHSSLISDDGLGHNYILQSADSKFTCLQLEHQMQMDILRFYAFDVDFAPLAGIEYQKRHLIYPGQAELKTSDVNVFFGIRTLPRLLLTERFSLQSGFDSFFYLPYLNMGSLKRWNSRHDQIESTPYHGFYYRTRFHCALVYRIEDRDLLKLGYRHERTVGFANRTPLFYIDELIHHRMDELHRIYLEYQL